MKPLLVLVGLGVLVGGGIAIANAMSGNKTATMRRGGAYRFLVYDEGSLTPQAIAEMGFASITVDGNNDVIIDGQQWVWVQAIWAGEDNATLTLHKDMSTPEYLGMPGVARSTNPNTINPGLIQYIPGQVNFNT